ncbi:hypothetical protein GGTG_07264 [Gaeumannomyces tritici R3-111a-1]|uniref:Bilirubin oxidase n=1 Tax=Gaeumannomyces tritici (strain R3-111a-1) TaxID=644352 RepID=J3P167_GAET3|nr:hypothetical protein GGTG_07264 [Gaeumannomyces tritici R3-111a-1]EJT77352.1 hypothetical protein GGTG_07264 [Gaeumannomyces tritici R3-111a-1]
MRTAFGLAALFAFTSVTAQSAFPTYENNIPETEKVALASIAEDDPNDFMSIMKKDESPLYPLIYKTPLPIPPIKQPLKKFTNPVSGAEIWYYEVQVKQFRQQIFPDLGAATFNGYDGMSPGPTIMVPRGTESIVRFINVANTPSSVHLHGSYSRAPWDGWAEDITQPGEYKDYYYPNRQSARLLWYHDHAMHVTAENAYTGLAGAYLIHDASEDSLGLPSGYGRYDVPLILTSKQYNRDGSLFSSVGEDTSLWGDVIHVNGQPWPFLNVEPRKYRFRFLNAAISRSFALYFAAALDTSAKLPFRVIASDGGLLENPVQVSQMYIANAERYEVVFDFSQFAGQAVDLRNLPKAGGVGVEDDYDDTDKVMRFVVSSAVTAPDTSLVPAKLRTVPFPTARNGKSIYHHFRFHRTNSEWRINGVGFADVQNRILGNVPRGTVEIWELENSSGGWSHPIHIHLVDFKVLGRSGSDRGVMPYEAVGLKDVVWLGRGETVLVEAHYAPWDGVYMFHCHNLIHEDQDMMAAFNVTALPNFGYNETTHFIDPMENRWRAKAFTTTDLGSRTGPFGDAEIEQQVMFLAGTNPYSNAEDITKSLDEYWAARGVKAKRVAVRDAEEPAGAIPRYRRGRN